MTSEAFGHRVQSLRDSWAERREIKSVAGSHDLQSQCFLLRTLHGWATESVHEIQSVYGEALYISLSPPPVLDGFGASFSLYLASQFTLTFSLVARDGAGGTRWSVAVALRSSGPGGGATAVGPERRSGHWTRSRLEDLVLSALGAWERAQSGRAGQRGAAGVSMGSRRVNLSTRR